MSQSFQYVDPVIRVPLAQTARKGELLDVQISFTANPAKNGRKLGLAFVDPLGIDPSRPTQVWTLGQPEDNRYWYPAWDYPNDRMTFDLSLTVPDRFVTAANGQLVGRQPAGGGLRTDRWVLEKPHVNYLTAFAVGEYTIITDTYRRQDGSTIPLAYFVEPDEALNAMLVFGETPAMMKYFEDKLGLAYPWENYKQICVRDFTARGMENTTATIMYDKLQHDARARLDYTGTDLIIHELAHQWFGNLLTCRNWAHLPLNEGFASYFERLYLEEAQGMGEAQYQTIQDRNLYLEEAKSKLRPVIWYNYDDPNELYDRHTYQKSALVLHQLRYELGDDVWWQGVRKYVRDNAFQQVVLEDFQQAMQEAAGKQLGGFFEQWYRRPGHPELEVTHSYDRGRGLYDVHVKQVQDSVAIGPFAFYVNIEVNMTGFPAWTEKYRVASRDTTFRFAVASSIDFVQFDSGDWLLADIRVEKEVSEWINQVRLDDEMASRLEAVEALGGLEPENRIRDALLGVVSADSSPYVREAAVGALDTYSENDTLRTALVGAMRADNSSRVRRSILNTLNGRADGYLKEALHISLQDSSYYVVANAVETYAVSFPSEFAVAVRPLFNLTSWEHKVELAMIHSYGKVASLEGIPYLEKFIDPESGEALQVATVKAMSLIAQKHSDVKGALTNSIASVLNSVHEPVRYAAAQSLIPLKDASKSDLIDSYIQSESSARVREALRKLTQ